MVFAFLMVADPKSGSAAIAKLKGLDCIRRITGQILVEYRHRAVDVAVHVILRWDEESLASLVVAGHGTSWGKAGTEDRRGTKSIWKMVTVPCGIRVNL